MWHVCGEEKCSRDLVRKHEGPRAPGRPRRRRKITVKINFMELECEGMYLTIRASVVFLWTWEWIFSVHNMQECLAHVKVKVATLYAHVNREDMWKFRDPALKRGRRSATCSGHFASAKYQVSTVQQAGWVSRLVSTARKISPLPEFDFWTSRSIAIRYPRRPWIDIQLLNWSRRNVLHGFNLMSQSVG